MRLFILSIFLLISQSLYSQAFLDSYKKFQEVKIKRDNLLDSIRKTELNRTTILTKKKIRDSKKARLNYLNQQVQQFSTVFRDYSTKSGFDFNTADSLLIIYQTGVESNLRSFLILSGKDTISYSEKWQRTGLHNYNREVVYQPFFDTTANPKGYKVIDVRDSLLVLANNRNCGIAQLIAKNNQVFDGETSAFIYARKVKGKYLIEECFLPAFAFVPIWRKE